jgi:SAM-dependent methyltransferase
MVVKETSHMEEGTKTTRWRDYPHLGRVVECVGAKSAFQKKAVARFLDGMDARYFDFAEGFILRLMEVAKRDQAHEYLATLYLNYTKSIKVEEIFFAKERRYRAANFADVYGRVYSRDDYMLEYVIGLGMTQIFWPNHWAIVRFFLDRFLPRVGQSKTGAEVGCGHGLFQAELLRGAPDLHTTLLDISPTSLDVTVRMIAATGLDPARATARQCDVQQEIPLEESSLDVLLLGEIIEHLDQGDRVMETVRRKVKADGVCFFTTAANAPAEDHILLFRSVGEIRQFLGASGWSVVEEQVGTLGSMTAEEAERGGHNVNYAAVLAPTV